MSDLIERLRTDNEGCGERCDEAADEIERLRAEVDRRHGIGGELIIARRERDEAKAEIERLRAELAEANAKAARNEGAIASPTRFCNKCGYCGPNEVHNVPREIFQCSYAAFPLKMQKPPQGPMTYPCGSLGEEVEP